MINIQNLSFTYPNSSHSNCVVDSLQIKPGTCIVVCGKSGSGKSTFIKLLNGLIPNFYEGNYEGELEVYGLNQTHSLVEFSEVVSSVFQNPASQFFHRKVIDELVFSCENHGINPSEINSRLNYVSKLFKIEHLLEKDLDTCSGGEQQKIAIATALMRKPKVILMDEPTANLDEQGVNMVKQAIDLLKNEGVTIIIAEHRLSYLNDLADKYLYFNQGKLQQVFNPEEFMTIPEELRVKLGLRKISDDVIHFKEGISKAGLHLENVVIAYPNLELGIIENHTFNQNEIIGIVGENGSGKSTLVKMIAGLKKGSSFYLNEVLQSEKMRLSNTSMVLQDVRLQLFSDSVSKELNLKSKDNTVVTQLGLERLLEKHPSCLSCGEMQRVVIAQALLSQKEVLIFDEPTSGLDYENMVKVSELIQSIKQENHIILIISHDYEFLNLCCDSIYQIYS